LPSGGGSGSGNGNGSDSGNGSGNGSDTGVEAAGVGGNGAGAVGGNGGVEQVPRTDTTHDIIIEGDQPILDEDEEPSGKRKKKCTSDVWEHYTKKKLVIEDNGKTYLQHWAYGKWPRCKHRGRCESNYGTIGFWTHLRVAHSVQKGQQQLKEKTDAEKGITVVVPYRYDEETSLKKFYLAIVMHEYPFNISEHEYFVDFIKSLCPSFPI
jgi:hypothetical protein